MVDEITGSIPEIPKDFPTQPALNTTAGHLFNALTHGIPDMKDWPVQNEQEVQKLIDEKGGMVPNFNRMHGEMHGDWPNIERTAFDEIHADNMNNGNIGKKHTRTNETIAYQAFLMKYFGLDTPNRAQERSGSGLIEQASILEIGRLR